MNAFLFIVISEKALFLCHFIYPAKGNWNIKLRVCFSSGGLDPFQITCAWQRQGRDQRGGHPKQLFRASCDCAVLLVIDACMHAYIHTYMHACMHACMMYICMMWFHHYVMWFHHCMMGFPHYVMWFHHCMMARNGETKSHNDETTSRNGETTTCNKE